jgi:hypothetical protein
VKLTTHIHLVPRLKMVDLYLHSTIRFYGVMLNQLSTDYFTLFTLTDLQTGSGIHPTSYPMGTRGKAARGVELTTHLQLVPR